MQWFRPYIIVFLVLAVTFGFFKGMIEPETFGVFATGLIAWWFRSRDESKSKEK